MSDTADTKCNSSSAPGWMDTRLLYIVFVNIYPICSLKTCVTQDKLMHIYQSEFKVIHSVDMV